MEGRRGEVETSPCHSFYTVSLSREVDGLFQIWQLPGVDAKVERKSYLGLLSL